MTRIPTNEAELIVKVRNYEIELKAKDDEIRKLNDAYANVVCDFEGAVMEIEALKSRSCEGCKFYDIVSRINTCSNCARFFIDKYELKEQ